MRIKLHQIVTIIALLSLPYINFAQAPVLGSLQGFVLFTGNGAVSNTGISRLTGNIGTNTGANTNFGNVNGVMHENDGATLLASNELLLAYDQLDNAIPTFFPAPLLGGGDTLDAGVYSITGNTTLDGELTLDGQGDPNAVFIFQIEAPFSSTAASAVTLINGAKACNVFWKIEGLVSLASGTKMRGTIVAHNAAIATGTGVELEGRALSTTGAITVDGIFAYTPTGCGSPLLTGPLAPALGAAGCYGIFSGNGSVINSGITNEVGDIGTNVGLTTGFDPLNVTGIIHPIPDVSTATCAADLLTVYNYLNVLPSDIELLYPAQFGNGLVLTPHTYVMNGATSFTDTLFLNAEGNANAVFVLQLNGALTTSTFSVVALVNGAQAANVFWKVEGAVTINDFSVFKGTIICNAGALTLNTGVQLEGRALTTDGALNTFAITTGMAPVSCFPLSVDWLYFRGKTAGETVILEWATAKETGNDFFTIEKSLDGRSFEKLATVKNHEKNEKGDYSFVDVQPASLNYYRISQTDLSGQRTYFRTIEVRTGKPASHQAQGIASFYPNPWTTTLTVSLNSDPEGAPSDLYIYDMVGKQVMKIAITQQTTLIKKDLPSGVYFYKMMGKEQTVQTGKLIVQ